MKRLAAAAALTLLLTACGPDLGSGRTACQLITKTDIQKALTAIKPTDGVGSGAKERSGCSYADSEKLAKGPQISIDLDRSGGDAMLEQSRARVQKQAGRSVRPEQNLGDEAFLDQPSGGFASTIVTRSGDAVLFISVSGSFESAQQARALARIGLSRL